MTEKTKFVLKLIGGLCAGIGLASWPWDSHPPFSPHRLLSALIVHVAPRIGEALMIATLLALGVDTAAKRVLIDEIAENISAHVAGRLLPQHLREAILGYLNTPFVRTRWDITYSIREWPGKPGFVELTTRNEFDVENRSDRPRDYEYLFDVDESWFSDIGATRITHAYLTVAGETRIDYDENALKQKLIAGEKSTVFRETVKIPPTPHSMHHFMTESIECYRDSFDSVFVPSVPVLETTITVNYPTDTFIVDIDFYITGSRSAIERMDMATGTQWSIRQPMLPGQCVTTRWERKSATSECGNT